MHGQARQTKSEHSHKPSYSPQVIAVLAATWEASGYPWSVRLKALLPIWPPWAKKRFVVPAAVELNRRLASAG
jgi:hypothetical protein